MVAFPVLMSAKSRQSVVKLVNRPIWLNDTMGPSAQDGGRLGLIARRGAMVEAFSRAAFALEVGQLSEPVPTRFGVHLIRCDEIKPGSKTMAEVRKELEEALAHELIDKLAQLERRHTPVKFTGKGPYFKPGTRELVLP